MLLSIVHDGTSLLNLEGVVLIRAKVDECVNTGKHATVEVSDPHGKLDNYVSVLDIPSQVTLRYSSELNGTRYDSSLQLWFIVGYRNSGFTAVIDLVDLVGILDLTNGVKGYRGTASEIAKQSLAEVASTYHYDLAIEESLKIVWLLQQTGESCYSFIMDRLRPLAISKDNRANYVLYTSGHKLHFAPYDYDSLVVKLDSSTLRNKFRYAKMYDSIKAGAAGKFAVSYNPLTGTTLTYGEQGDSALKTGSVSTTFQKYAQNFYACSTYENSDYEAGCRVRNIVEDALMASYELVFSSVVLVPLDIGNAVVSNYTNEGEKVQSWDGLWYIRSKHWQFENKTTTMIVRCCRNQKQKTEFSDSVDTDEGTTNQPMRSDAVTTVSTSMEAQDPSS